MPETTSVQVIGGPDSTNDDIKEMEKLDEVLPKEDDKEVIVPPKEDEEEPKEKDSEELEEDEKELDEEIEDKDEVLASGKTRPSFGAIKKKYPNFFKDFPEMQEAVGRERAFTEIFSEVDDAREAKEKADDYNYLENLVAQGTTESTKEFLDTMKENNEDNYKGYVSTFLPALAKADSDTYFAITLPIMQNILRGAYREGVSNGNKNLEASSLWLAKYLFGDDSYAKGEKSLPEFKSEKKTDPDREKFNKEKEEFYSKQAQSFERTTLVTAEKRLFAIIEDGLDPNDELSEFEKKHLVKDIAEKIGETLDGDDLHISRMNGLWKQAVKSAYSEESKNRIISAYLSRVKTILPDVRKELKALAKGRKPPVENNERKAPTGGRSSSNRKSITREEASKMSDRDMLN